MEYSTVPWTKQPGSSLGGIIMHNTSPTDYLSKETKENPKKATKKKEGNVKGDKPHCCSAEGCSR